MNEWISCKDEPPKKYGRYLVTAFYGDYRGVFIATWIKETARWHSEKYGGIVNVVAWMPLPEPYYEV